MEVIQSQEKLCKWSYSSEFVNVQKSEEIVKKKAIMNKKWASNEQVRNKSVTNCE